MASKKKILVVEDEKPMARALKLKLNNAGFEATTAHNGQEALAALDEGTYDVMLLDLVMPVMDGFSVLEEVKARKIKVTVLVSTNLSQPEDAQRAKKLGAKEHFVKSNTPITEVVKHVQEALGG